jgi:aspartyl-tRNA(Asn)/glutamyl-tRNA(Gln) amidotransferase subunit B
VANGRLRVQMDDGRVLDVEIQRAHLEEDAESRCTTRFHAATAIDLNRSGTPLLEIVSAPVLHSAPRPWLHAHRAYARALARHLRRQMQEGSFRCDANVSVRPSGESKLGTRRDQNVNSFRFVEKAIEYEIERQIRALESGEAIVQETRLYDAAHHHTRPMRGKEDAHDYRYFPDPDLPPLTVTEADIAAIVTQMPELPDARVALRRGTGFADADAAQLVPTRHRPIFRGGAGDTVGRRGAAVDRAMPETARRRPSSRPTGSR